MFDQETYLHFAPKKIESEEQYEQYLLLVESLLSNKDKNIEKEAICHILILLIEEYEKEKYPISTPEPLNFLVGLMELKGLKQKDLVGVIGSKGVVSEVFNGKREITKNQAKALSEFFKVNYKDFL